MSQSRVMGLQDGLLFGMIAMPCLSAPRNFIVTAHAQHRAAERGITKEHFVEAVSNPDQRKKQRHGDHGGIVYLFIKKMEQRELHIAAEIFKEDCFFITGYWQ